MQGGTFWRYNATPPKNQGHSSLKPQYKFPLFSAVWSRGLCLDGGKKEITMTNDVLRQVIESEREGKKISGDTRLQKGGWLLLGYLLGANINRVAVQNCKLCSTYHFHHYIPTMHISNDDCESRHYLCTVMCATALDKWRCINCQVKHSSFIHPVICNYGSDWNLLVPVE